MAGKTFLHQLSGGIHPHSSAAYNARGNLPDIDIDIACNLGETFEVGGETFTVPSFNGYRYIVYDNQIQHIRNEKSFLDYHKQHTGSLEKIMTNMVWAQLLSAEVLEKMYMHADNRHHKRPMYNPRASAFGYVHTSVIPMYVLMEKSQRWLQGVIIEAYGAKGFDIIKRAKEKATEKHKIEEAAKAKEESQSLSPAEILAKMTAAINGNPYFDIKEWVQDTAQMLNGVNTSSLDFNDWMSLNINKSKQEEE